MCPICQGEHIVQVRAITMRVETGNGGQSEAACAGGHSFGCRRSRSSKARSADRSVIGKASAAAEQVDEQVAAGRQKPMTVASAAKVLLRLLETRHSGS